MTNTPITQAIEKVDEECPYRLLKLANDTTPCAPECKWSVHGLVREVAKVAQERMRAQTIQQCINEAGISEIAAAMIGGEGATRNKIMAATANAIKKKIAALPLELGDDDG